MKIKKIYIIDKSKVFAIAVLIIWCFFAFRMVTTQLKIALKTDVKIGALTLEQE